MPYALEYHVQMLRALAELLGAVAWPTAVATIAWIFRAEIGRLIDRLRAAGMGSTRLDFAQEMQNTLEGVATVATGGGDENAQLIVEAVGEPQLLISRAWAKVEQAARGYYERIGRRFPVPNPGSRHPLFWDLRELLVNGSENHHLLRSLEQMKHRVSHEPDLTLSTADVLAYAMLAEKAVKMFESLPGKPDASPE